MTGVVLVVATIGSAMVQILDVRVVAYWPLWHCVWWEPPFVSGGLMVLAACEWSTCPLAVAASLTFCLFIC